MPPNVAYITAAYNASQFIMDCIKSVHDQSYDGNIHHYIIDDASTDDTVDIVLNNGHFNKIEAFDYDLYESDRLTLIALRKNGRQGRARNFGIKHAWEWADCFVILDADDIKYPLFTSRHVEEWLRDPQKIGVVYSDYDIFDTNDNSIRIEYKFAYSYERLHQECIVSSGALVSKQAILQCGLYDEQASPAEDYGMWLRISNFFIMRHIPESLWQYKVHNNNSTNASNIKQIQQAHQIMANNYNLWRQNPQGYLC